MSQGTYISLRKSCLLILVPVIAYVVISVAFKNATQCDERVVYLPGKMPSTQINIENDTRIRQTSSASVVASTSDSRRNDSTSSSSPIVSAARGAIPAPCHERTDQLMCLIIVDEITCRWCISAWQCVNGSEVCYTTPFKKPSTPPPPPLPISNTQCAALISLTACASDRGCMWCPRTKQCDARDISRSDCHWCAQPFITMEYQDSTSGFTNQRMWMHSGLFFAYAVGGVGVLSPLQARNEMAWNPWQKQRSRWVDKPMSFVYDIAEFHRRTEDDFCIVESLPSQFASHAKTKHEDPARPMFGGASLLSARRMYKEFFWNNIPAPVTSLGTTYLRMMPGIDEVTQAEQLQFAYRPNEVWRTQINAAIGELRAMGVKRGCVDAFGRGVHNGIHLRIEADWLKFKGSVVNATFLRDFVIRTRYHNCSAPLYIASGMTPRERAEDPRIRDFLRVFCDGQLCVYPDELHLPSLSNDEQRVDFVAMRDFGVVVEAESFWGCGGSTMSVAAGLERQAETRVTHLFEGVSNADYLAYFMTGRTVDWKLP